MKILNSDDHFERLLKDAGLDSKMPPEEKQPRDVARDRAKELTTFQRRNFVRGRLGLIIDGTGKDYDKITNQARQLEALGYDTHMIFVNTSLDVALQRNAERPRKLAEPLVVQSWNDVQKNIGKFQNLFGGNFRIVDNTVYKPIAREVQKAVNKFVRKPIYNPIGKQWIENAKALKKAGFIKK